MGFFNNISILFLSFHLFQSLFTNTLSIPQPISSLYFQKNRSSLFFSRLHVDNLSNLFIQFKLAQSVYFNISQFLQEMNKKIFYRNQLGKSSQLFRATRSNKLSMDDLTPLISRAPSDLKKRNSNDNCQYSKIERSTEKKSKMNSTISIGASMFLTKNNSPLKFSIRNSQVLVDDKNKLKNYKFYYQIGFGGFGRVWKVCAKDEVQDWAMKQISKKKVIQKNNIESVLNQRKILSQLSHPFLINMKCSFQDNQNLYLVMDYLRGGDLRYHICYKNGFTEKEIKFITANIVIGLEYIHANRIIHKDIKPENIVFEENGYVRITDFGIAKSELNDSAMNTRNQSSGTPVYMAPQILFKKEYSYQSDYYALGVIVYQLTMGRRPFQGKNRNQIRDQIMRKDVQLSQDDLPIGWSPYLADLINKLLRKNPQHRLGFKGAKQIKEHKYFADMKWKKMQRKQIKPPFIPHVICQMKEYLDEISLFNQLNEQSNQENSCPIERQINQKFVQYDYDRVLVKKPIKLLKNNLKKCKRMSQKKIIA